MASGQWSPTMHYALSPPWPGVKSHMQHCCQHFLGNHPSKSRQVPSPSVSYPATGEHPYLHAHTTTDILTTGSHTHLPRPLHNLASMCRLCSILLVLALAGCWVILPKLDSRRLRGPVGICQLAATQPTTNLQGSSTAAAGQQQSSSSALLPQLHSWFYSTAQPDVRCLCALCCSPHVCIG